MTEPTKKKLYVSCSAFALGRQIITDAPSGCVRNILLSANGVRSFNIPEKYSIMGERNEEDYEKDLQKDNRIEGCERETNMVPVSVTANVELRGRRDFITTGKFTVIHECKSTYNKAAFRKRCKEPKLSHVAQLVQYLVADKLDKGKLQQGLYTWTDVDKLEGLERAEEHITKVEISNAGAILLNGERYRYNVHDLLQHRVIAAGCIEKSLVWDRPEGWDRKWGSPCGLCFAREVCDRYDAGDIKTSEEFIEEARTLIGEE